MTIRLLWISAFFIALCAMTDIAFADPADRLSFLFKQTLEEKINHAEIEFPSLDKVAESAELSVFAKFNRVRLIEDMPSGIAIFEVSGENAEGQSLSTVVQTPYRAWVKVPVAIHRIYPNTKLKTEDFKTESVNVATGQPREYRGVLAKADTAFDRMESRQTILENQFVVTTAIQKQPDVRKGDSVKLDLVAGDLILTTQAVALEPGSVGDHVRVLTIKTKKEIMGTIAENHSVEVNL